MTLNVQGETAFACPHSDFHIVAATGQEATDLGKSPAIGASALLVDDDRAFLIGGFGPHYDVVTPLIVTSSGPHRVGQQGRIVMPDGLELPSRSGGRGVWGCRGPDAHAAIWTTHYRISLDDVFQTLT